MKLSVIIEIESIEWIIEIFDSNISECVGCLCDCKHEKYECIKYQFIITVRTIDLLMHWKSIHWTDISFQTNSKT